MKPANADSVLEMLRPRMRSARAAHLRRLVATALVVPAAAVGAAAMAADGAADSGTETAVEAVVEDQAPRFVAPEIGLAGGDQAPIVAPAPTEEEKPEEEDDAAAESEAPVQVSFGEIGHATLQPVPEGLGFELLDTDLADGWVVERVEREGDKLLIVVRRGDVLKLIEVRPADGDRIDVEIRDVRLPVVPTTTTTEPPPTTVAPVPVERVVVEVPGRGSFVADREGEHIHLVSVSPAPGHDAEVVRESGWKVHVVFTDGGWNWHAKASIDDDGTVKRHTWDEERIADPIYQWVEIPEVGAVKFKLYDHQIWVKEIRTAPGIEGWDENGGQPGETGKVAFEGEGGWWCVEAFPADDEIVWEIDSGGDIVS